MRPRVALFGHIPMTLSAKIGKRSIITAFKRSTLSNIPSKQQVYLRSSPSASIPISRSLATMPTKLNRDSINPAVLNVQYAVRGELALKADKYAHQLADGQGGSLPFDRVVTANIGNPQQKGLDQRPITFWRQVISLLEYPALMEEHLDVARKIYPEDAIARAKSLHEEIGSTGAYTHSKGILGIRKRVAKYIEGEQFINHS